MLNDLLRFDVKDCSWCRWVASEPQLPFPPEFGSPVPGPDCQQSRARESQREASRSR